MAQQMQVIRDRSIQKAMAMGYEVNASLPLLDEGISIRAKNEIIDRCLTLFATVAGSYGFAKADAMDWLKQEKLDCGLSPSELLFLTDADNQQVYYQKQVEALNAFAWVLGYVHEMEFDQICANNLITLYPEIKNKDACSEFRTKSNLRSLEELVEKCDLAYCLHWAIKQAELSNRRLPNDIGAYVIIERRRVLEWVLSDHDWQDVSLDT